MPELFLTLPELPNKDTYFVVFFWLVFDDFAKAVWKLHIPKLSVHNFWQIWHGPGPLRPSFNRVFMVFAVLVIPVFSCRLYFFRRLCGSFIGTRGGFFAFRGTLSPLRVQALRRAARHRFHLQARACRATESETKRKRLAPPQRVNNI